MEYTKEKYLDLYSKLYFCRNYEDVSKKLFLEGKFSGFCHLAHGQEAMYVGIQDELGENDWLSPQWRGNSQYAMRMGPRDFTAELFGKKDGTSAGLAGPDHVYSAKAQIGLMSGFLGQGVAMGVGIALAYKMNKRKGCVVVGIGDGEMNEGAVSEVLNMVAAWKLPCVIYVHNNEWGMSASFKETTGINTYTKRGEGFGLPSASYDGSDVLTVKKAMKEAIANAHNNKPSLLEFSTVRWEGHFIGDTDKYRDAELIKQQIAKTDPVANYRKYLLNEKIAADHELLAIQKEQEAVVFDAFEYAINCPVKTTEQMLNPKLFYAE